MFKNYRYLLYYGGIDKLYKFQSQGSLNLFNLHELLIYFSMVMISFDRVFIAVYSPIEILLHLKYISE